LVAASASMADGCRVRVAGDVVGWDAPGRQPELVGNHQPRKGARGKDQHLAWRRDDDDMPLGVSQDKCHQHRPRWVSEDHIRVAHPQRPTLQLLATPLHARVPCMLAESQCPLVHLAIYEFWCNKFCVSCYCEILDTSLGSNMHAVSFSSGTSYSLVLSTGQIPAEFAIPKLKLTWFSGNLRGDGPWEWGRLAEARRSTQFKRFWSFLFIFYFSFICLLLQGCNTYH
jgi:hypothetical protein